jgi:hydrogenase 3 maturation protease
VGIGQELRGDDAAGPRVAQGLAARVPPSPRLLILDAGHAPENQTGALRRFAPDVVLLVDAARMEEPPGAVRWLEWRDSVGLPGSTHTLPPSLLAEYLVAQLGCRVFLLGIQPLHTEIGCPMSPAVEQAVADVVGTLGPLL